MMCKTENGYAEHFRTALREESLDLKPRYLKAHTVSTHVLSYQFSAFLGGAAFEVLLMMIITEIISRPSFIKRKLATKWHPVNERHHNNKSRMYILPLPLT